jgi:cephalosporin hydroxylase
MRLTIDSDKQILIDEASGKSHSLYSEDAFELLSDIWVKVGWNQKHIYTFTWMGRPIIQLPEDMVRAQEVVYTVRPNVIIETGIAHGGSLVFNASLLKMLGIDGRVIGIDIDIRQHNRKAIEEHPLFSYLTLIEGSSIDEATVEQVRSMIKQDDKVMVFLDSNHSKEHVLAELRAYGGLVTKGSYIVATDGVMREVADVPRAGTDWEWDNPISAVEEFLAENSDFELRRPDWLFNESNLKREITHWPSAWLRRKG